MKHPRFRKGNAVILVAGSIGFVFGCMGTPNSVGLDAKTQSNVPDEPFVSSGMSSFENANQCEKDTDMTAGCDVYIRVRQDGDMTPAIRLMVHEIDTQHTLRSIEVPYAAGAFFHARLSQGTYHINLIGDGTESTTFPLWSCEGDNSQTYWERDLKQASARAVGRLIGRNVQPVKGAELLLQRENQDGVLHVPVEADGRFSIDLPAGRYEYIATAPSHGAQRGTLRIAKNGKLKMPLQLDWRPVLRGWVRTQAGTPARSAHVFLGPSFDPKTPPNVVLTDANGHFEIPAVPGAGLRLSVWTGKQYAVASVAGLDGSAKEADIDLLLQPGREMSGWVQKPDGRPHAFGVIRFRIKHLGMVGTAKADAEGKFQLQGLPRDADVELWAEGNATGAWGAVVASARQNRVLVTYQAPAY